MAATPEHEDIDFEPEDEFGTAGAAKAKMQKLREELDKVRAERQEYLDGWQRCKADTVNVRKDLESRAQRSGELAKEALAHDIIPALDSFDMATQSETWATVSDGFRSGMEYVRNQLLDALRRNGIDSYGKVGDVFDHALYEAMEEREGGNGESGTVVKVLRLGYRSGEKVLRPAQVVVKK